MTQNKWRLSGGLGIQPDPRDPDQEVMTQGIGFPLRPVDNVPLQDSENLDGIVAEGLFMQWMGQWQAGIYYPKGAYVIDGLFACIANKITLGKPAPVPFAAPTWALPTPWAGAVTKNNLSVVVSGHTYTFTEPGWVTRVRVQAPELTDDTNYRVTTIFENSLGELFTSVIDDPILVEDDWSVLVLLNQIVVAGSKLTVNLDVLNSGANTNISGGWAYQGPSQTGAPQAQNWTIDNQRTSFRIDKFDLDATDRGTELEGVTPDSVISIVQTDNVGLNSEYRVTTVTDNGTYMTYGVILQDESGGGPQASAVCTVDIDVPIPLPTEYDEQTGVWPAGNPSWATVEGHLSFDGVDQGVPVGNAYGVDIEFEPATVSEDWDIVAITGA